ncbi:hypothetical protein [Halopiger xanaduensis]|uniref:Uncharacterized protein n=1 Tax=Halopiger xanaduensis (strain DSM 18323 / JCM 14033 / SH-6) TaxID=797210 RepID=F8D5Y5_HALXS|nr:hypothetical protein [Halopiger xanaduensis]AEH37712.1 hypothetical protein Halxa_3098 [Halopiger xanaduensis SH-6]
MIGDAPVDGLYAGSNGDYYTDWEVTRNLRRGTWRPCIRQREPDRRLVETTGGGLLMLTAIEPTALPTWVEIRVAGETARVVDTRYPSLETRR